MTEEKQAVKTLAEELVRAMKSVSSKAGKGPVSTQIYSSGNAETIYASQIIGLPDALYLALNDVEDKAATDEMAAALLNLFHRISAIEVGNIAADTAQIENLYATFGDFISLVAESAQIGSLDVEQIRADLATIGLTNINQAKINSAQIVKLSTDTAFIREGVQGEIYIDDLAVSEANIVNLAVGTLLLNNQNGDLVRLYVNDQGQPVTEAVSYSGDSIINNNSLNGSRIVQNSITTSRLNTSEIFAKNALVMDLIADNINATRLFANEGVIPVLETTVISSQNIGENLDISSNSTITMLNDRISLFASSTGRTYLQKNQPFPTIEGDVWFDPTKEEHYVATGKFLTENPQFAYDDDGYLKYLYPTHTELDISINNSDDLILEDNVEDVDYYIDDGFLSATGMWKKVENVAFSNLTVAVDGIESEVFDSETGSSRITQNASSITSLIEKTDINSLGQGETLYSKISQNASDISSVVSKTGINSLGQSETLYSKIQQSESGITSLVTKTGVNELGDSETLYGKISLTADGIETLVSKTGINSLEQSETLYSKIGQTESSITSIVSKTGINSLGQSETLYSKIGQTESSINLIVNGTTAVGKVSTSGIDIQNNSLTVKSSGSISLNAGGTLNATAGTVNLTTNDITIGFNTSGSSDTASKVKINKTDGIKVYDSHGSYFQATGDRIGLYSSNGTARLTMDSDGNATFAGKMSASNLTTGTIDANSITINNIDASKITVGTIKASQIDSTSLHVNAANIDGTLTIGKLPNTVAQKTDNISQFTNDSGYQNSTQVTTITENTIKTTSVVATNLHVKAANIDDTLSASKIKGGTLTLGGTNTSGGYGGGSITMYGANNSDIFGIWDNNGLTINSGKITVNGGGTFTGITVAGNASITGNATISGNIQITDAGSIYTRNGSIYTAGQYGECRLTDGRCIIKEPLAGTKKTTYDYNGIYSIYYDESNDATYSININVDKIFMSKAAGDGTTIPFYVRDGAVNDFVMNDHCKTNVAYQIAPYIVGKTIVRNVATNENGNVNLGLSGTRYIVLAIRASGDSTLIATPYCYYNNTNNTWNWYAHVTPSTDTSTSWANKTGIYTVAYIDLGANGF